MKKFLLAVLLISLASCTPETKTSKPSKSKVSIRDEITKIVATHTSCSEYSWKNRGKAPKAYIEGIALMYAKQFCGQGTDFIKSDKITGSNSIQVMKDALAFYGIKGSQLNTYTFLMGLGMRESSGKHCEGRDRSASFTDSDSAEAGLYQTSYVSRLFNKELKPLYLKYATGDLNCEVATFGKGISCSSYNAINHGTGPGVAWQDLTKKCPALAVQWGAILIRSNYRHFGPIRKKEVEFRAACKTMLGAVEEVALDNCPVSFK